MAIIRKQLELEVTEEEILDKAKQILRNIHFEMATDETLYNYDSRPSVIEDLFDAVNALYSED